MSCNLGYTIKESSQVSWTQHWVEVQRWRVSLCARLPSQQQKMDQQITNLQDHIHLQSWYQLDRQSRFRGGEKQFGILRNLSKRKSIHGKYPSQDYHKVPYLLLQLQQGHQRDDLSRRIPSSLDPKKYYRGCWNGSFRHKENPCWQRHHRLYRGCRSSIRYQS